jgi:methylamine utilization protein MauE
MDTAQLSTSDYLMDGSQVAFGFVFLLAALGKIRSPQFFSSTIEQYEVLPKSAAPLAGAFIVVVEAFVAVGCLSGIAVMPAVVAGAITLAAFAVAVGVNLERGRDIACGCFGAREESISARSLGRIATLIGIAIVVLVLRTRGAMPLRLNSVQWTDQHDVEYVFEVLLMTAFLLIVGAWLLRAEELLAVFETGREQQTTEVN